MTDKDKTRIIELQSKGLGYKRIATLTGLPVNSVRYFCRTHPVDIDIEACIKLATPAFCKNCSTPLAIKPKCKPKTFCSNACRMKWWAEHPDDMNRKAWHAYTCPQCGRVFQIYANIHRKYCSKDCATIARRKTNKTEPGKEVF